MKTVTVVAASALALLVAASPVLAAQQLAKDAGLGKTEAEVSAALKGMGATIEELDSEESVIEAQYSLDGQSHEVRVDATNGRILSTDASGDDEADDE